MERQNVTDLQLNIGLNAVAKAMLERINKHGAGAFITTHEALGVITEENVELIHAIKSKDEDEILKELMDVAVPAIFAYICLKNKLTVID